MTRISTPLHRRAVLAGLAGAAASALLAACGGEVAPTTAPANTAAPAAVLPTTAAAASATPAAPAPATTAAAMAVPAATVAARPATVAPAQMMTGRKVAIEYWHNDNGTRGEVVKRLMTRFNEGNAANGTIADKAFPNYVDLVQALQAALAARIQPAVVQVGYVYMRYFAEQIPHTSIDDMAKRDPQGAEFLSGRNFAPAILDLGRVDGVLHGMPYAMSNPLVWYNADLLKQAGIERAGATWAEIRSQARQVLERTGKQGLHIAESTNFWAYQAFIESNGARVLVGTGKDVRCGMDSPEAIEAMRFVQDMIREKSAVSLAYRQADMNFASGELAMFVDSSTNFQRVSANARFAVGSVPLPAWGSKPRRVPVGGNALFIFGRDVEQQAAAWEWIKFVHAPENMTTWAKETGYLPPRIGLADNPMYLKTFFDTTPLLRPALEQAADAVPWSAFPGKNGVEAEKELMDARAKILNGQDVTATLREVTQRVNQLIRE